MRTPHTLSDRITVLLEANGGDLRWLSEETGINHRTIIRMIDGESPLDFESAAIIAAALDVCPSILITGKD